MKNSSSSSISNLTLTLKAWPVIAIATIGLCFFTQLIAGWCGITLPEQTNVAIIRQMAGWNMRFAVNLALILVILPAVEELVFRGILFKLPMILLKWRWLFFAGASSVLFSAAHYCAQPWPDNAFIALAFFGLAQCWLYRKTNHIWCPMLNHALFNLTNLILLFIVPEQGAMP